MSAKRGSYDSRCHDLALCFLDDEDLPTEILVDAANVLAQHIQRAIEDFLEFDLAEIRKDLEDRDEHLKEEAALLKRQERRP